MVAEKRRLVPAPNAIENDIPEITTLPHLAHHALKRIEQPVARKGNLGIPELDADDRITMVFHTADDLQIISLSVNLDKADIGWKDDAPGQIRGPFYPFRQSKAPRAYRAGPGCGKR